MKMFAFASRNAKEILRDPLNLGFGLGFPLALLFLLSAIQANVPVKLFEIDMLTPGISVFGLAFITLFTATIIARDRSSALLQRLYTTPMTALDFMLGYMLPMLPIGLGQCLICYAAALLLGLKFSWNIGCTVVLMLPIILLFVALGLLCGSVFTDKQVGGICGALLTNLTAWLSGTWFDVELAGGAFRIIAHALPFWHAVEMEKSVLTGSFANVMPHLCWVLAYAGFALILAVLLFLRQMKRQ